VGKENLKECLKELNIPGFDVSLEMSGSAAAFQSLPELTTHGGKIVLLGILPSNVSLNWHQVIFKMLTIKGIYGREIFRTWYQMTHLLESGLQIAPIITHRLPYTDYEKGFEIMLSGQCGKVILDWTK
jgi:threonine 3-dehydrogenase